MIIKRSSILPLPGYSAIMLFGICFVRKLSTFDSEDLKHETIHYEQAQSMGYLKFYYKYLIWWFKGQPTTGSSTAAYYTNPFEVEAYTKMTCPDYHPSKNSYKEFIVTDSLRTFMKITDSKSNMYNWIKYIRDIYGSK